MDIDAQIKAWESSRYAVQLAKPRERQGGRPPKRDKPDATASIPIGTIPERVAALVDSMSEHDRERLRDVIDRATKPQSGADPRYHMTLEEVALILWVATGRLYSREHIRNLESSALEKIRRVAIAET